MVVETDQYDYQVYDKLFDVKDITIDGQKDQDYQLDFRVGDQNLKMEYYAFRRSVDMTVFFDKLADKEFENLKEGPGEYWSKFAITTASGYIIGKKGVPFLADGIEGLVGNQERIEQNKKIDDAIHYSKKEDAKELEALQISGQMTYLNGELHVYNQVKDLEMSEYLMGTFEINVPITDKRYSVEYMNAYSEWYFLGHGDEHEHSGIWYRDNKLKSY